MMIKNSISAGGERREEMQRVLIVDDNEEFCRSMQKICMRQAMEADYKMSLIEGMEAARSRNYDIIFLDVNMPEGSGIDFIPKIRDTGSDPEIIIITGYGSKAGAEMAIRSGAWDYVQKSASHQDIQLLLNRVAQYRKQKSKKKSPLILRRDPIIGNSRQITNCLKIVALASASNYPVIITGETGTGKELFARAIYENTANPSGNFVVVDCSALPEKLVESTLFGHRKGAFTGADVDQEGLIKEARDGTLFLDEIGELPLFMQAKFLRILQEKRFRPVGEKKEESSNFRLISATNRNLSEMIKKDQFRNDLYYRIQTIRINLPPLRDRLEDIPDLIMKRISQSCAFLGEREPVMATGFLETLMSYKWPGNVRELFNIIDQVMSEARGEPVLFPRDLPPHIRTQATLDKLELADLGSRAKAPNNHRTSLPKTMKTHVEEAKKSYLKDLMTRTKGDITEACRLSELSRAHLYQLIKKYNINPHANRDSKKPD